MHNIRQIACTCEIHQEEGDVPIDHLELKIAIMSVIPRSLCNLSQCVFVIARHYCHDCKHCKKHYTHYSNKNNNC